MCVNMCEIAYDLWGLNTYAVNAKIVCVCVFL